MTAIDRTAYPRPGTRLTREELDARYDLTETDFTFIRANARGDVSRLVLATLLKTRRDLGCFPALDAVHPGTVAHLAAQLGTAAPHVSAGDKIPHWSSRVVWLRRSKTPSVRSSLP